MNKRDTLIYFASFVMLMLLVGLVGYLTFIPVPTDNKELIITVMGVLLGGGAAAMPNLFGDKDSETEKLRSRVRELESDIAVLKAEYRQTKDQYDTIVKMLVDRHLEPGKGAAILDES
jgi:predicted component of type VI protein secretion system